MRLRTTLALAFGLVSVVQVVAVAPPSLRRLDRTLEQQLEVRVKRAREAADAELDRLGADTRRAMDELAQSEALEGQADALLEGGGSPGAAGAAATLMGPRGLTVLSLFDARGRTLSSGHLPARLGDPDPALFAVTALPAGEMTPVQVEVRDEAGLRRVPALVTASRVAGEDGALRLWLVGGALLDQRAAARLSRLTGARVDITSAGRRVAAAGEALPPVRDEVLSLAPAAEVTLSFSRGELLKTEREVLSAFVALFALGLALAIGGGLYLARRFTRPVEALTRATARVASGELATHVSEPATGELGALVEAFNHMTTDLQRTTEQLVASERIAAWQEVARRLAHEIKNPLTPIQLSLETLIAARDTQPDQFTRLFPESARAVLEEVERLRRIVDEFSRFARLPHPQLAPLELGPFAAQVLALYAPARPGIRVGAQLGEGIGVEADRDQLTQVLINLIKNAEEALGETGTIEVRVRAEGEDALLEVHDSGPGIPAEAQARIFEPYFTTKGSGTGLGLAVAARIALEHRGRLTVRSAPREGTLFSLRLPRR